MRKFQTGSKQQGAAKHQKVLCGDSEVRNTMTNLLLKFDVAMKKI